MRVLAINSVIGAVFGAVFVIVNAGSLSTPAAIALRVIAVVALVVVVVRSRALRKLPDTGADGSPTYGRSYRLVVAAEIVALAAGLPIVRALVGNHAIVGWIALVVGLHFVGLATVWHRARFAVLAVVVAGCGLAGLLLANGSARTSIVATVSGVVPGVVLLAFALQAVLRANQRSDATSTSERTQAR